MNFINNILNNLQAVSLDEMNEVKLLNRFDTKYQLSISKLLKIIQGVEDQYYIMEIHGKRIHEYNTIYFDTPNNSFYTTHHNGKLNRIKVRKRSYVDSEISFLEIKQKNNKGKTNKLRILIDNINTKLSCEELEFIEKHTNSKNNINNGLEVKCQNTFHRITLVNKDFSERATIDLKLGFYADNRKLEFDDLAVIELKQGAANMKTPLSIELRKKRIYKSGFSKYCIGRSMMNSSLKQNLFKAKLLRLGKVYSIHTSPLQSCNKNLNSLKNKSLVEQTETL